MGVMGSLGLLAAQTHGAAHEVLQGAGAQLDGTWLTRLGVGFFVVPLLAALVLIFFGRKLPRQGDWVAQTAIVSCAAGALWLFWNVIVEHGTPGWSWWGHAEGLSWQWIGLAGGFDLTVGIFFDKLSVIMVTMVTIVASCIFFCSAGYMHGDRYYSRFFAYLAYFAFAMMGLVVVDNLLFLFIFWELVGVGSYLLIGFFFYEEEPPKASIKAFMVNRIGDVLFLIGIIICWRTFGTLQYPVVFETLRAGEFAALPAGHAFAGLSQHALLTLSGILIFCGAISKSAQIPLHTWLPDAMAGPTPVSALIHAATMVAAGVFMVGRMYPYFTPEALQFIAGVGALTALVGATMGLVMWDIKKVLAYSTMSQLGYMMLGLGVGGFTAGLFHLILHAFFKACLFLGSGSVIHAVHSQDMRDMGGLKKKMPVTYWTFLVATLALAGVPMFAGYYSKDQIVATALAWGMSHGVAHYVPFVFGAVGAFMTTFYMFRLVFLTFHGAPGDQHKHDHAHESPPVMAIPLIVLAVFAFLGGGTINPLPHFEHLWFNELVVQPESAAAAGLGLQGHDPEHWEHALHAAHYPALITSLLAIAIGFLLARRMYLTKATDAAAVKARFGPMYDVVANKWYFDDFQEKLVLPGLHKLNHACAWFDRTVVDGIVNGAGLVTRLLAFVSGLFDKYVIDGLVNFWRWFVRSLSAVLRVLQTGNVRDYLTMTLIGVLVLAMYLASE